MVSVWDMHIAPTRSRAFVVAGPVSFFAMSGCRRALLRRVETQAEAEKLADAMDEILRDVPEDQIGSALVAAMGAV